MTGKRKPLELCPTHLKEHKRKQKEEWYDKHKKKQGREKKKEIVRERTLEPWKSSWLETIVLKEIKEKEEKISSVRINLINGETITIELGWKVEKK